MIFCLLFLNILFFNYVVWWSTFVFMTLLFVLLCKDLIVYKSLVNYFIIQECLGLIFLVLVGSMLQFLVLMMKVGMAPLHFWLFSVASDLTGWLLVWFLTFQKVPFFPVLLYLLQLLYFLLLGFGILICYAQFFILKGYSNMFIISSTESFNWILMMSLFSFFSSGFLFVYYFLLMVFFIPKLSVGSQDFIMWETLLVFLNIPFSVSFFIKIFVLSGVLFLEELLILLILFVMCLSVFVLSFWLLNMSLKNFNLVLLDSKMFVWMVVPLTVVVLL